MEARSKITETVIRTIEVSIVTSFSSVRIVLATSKAVLKITPITDVNILFFILLPLGHSRTEPLVP